MRALERSGSKVVDRRDVRSRVPVLAGLALVLALGLLVAGCGVEGQDLTGDETSADVSTPEAVPSSELTVSADDIAATEPDSPERTVLIWWRALQSRDVEGVIDSYTKKVQDDLPDGFEFSIVSSLSPLAGQSTISIDSIDTNAPDKSGGGKQKSGEKKSGGSESDNADKAMVYTSIESPAPRLAGTVAIPMEKENGKWLISDSTFLVGLANLINRTFDESGSTTSPTTTTTG
ncbi:MAG: hypothetical protein U0R26_10645 [Solirubrobacterales bacterium]